MEHSLPYIDHLWQALRSRNVRSAFAAHFLLSVVVPLESALLLVALS